MAHMHTELTFSLIAACLLAGCAHHRAPCPARINHVVLIDLDDDAQTQACLEDCDRLLPTIETVTYYWGGVHGDFGRSTVDGEYDLALCVGFDDAQGYETYLVHPNHVELVDRWKPRFKWIRIHDVVDDNP